MQNEKIISKHEVEEEREYLKHIAKHLIEIHTNYIDAFKKQYNNQHDYELFISTSNKLLSMIKRMES